MCIKGFKAKEWQWRFLCGLKHAIFFDQVRQSLMAPRIHCARPKAGSLLGIDSALMHRFGLDGGRLAMFRCHTNAIIYLTWLPTSFASPIHTKTRQRIVLYIAGLPLAPQQISLTPKRLALPSAS